MNQTQQWEPFQYDIISFYSNNWLYKYSDKIAQYIDGVEFNNEIYSEVYKNIYVFIDQYSRHDQWFQTKVLHEYINIFNLFYKFFYSIFVKEKIELCIFAQLPHEGIEYVIYCIAKAMGIKTILFFQSSIPDAYKKSFIINDFEDFGEFKSMKKVYEKTNYKIQTYESNDHIFYMKNINYYKPQKPKISAIIKDVIILLKYSIFCQKKFYKIIQKTKWWKFKKYFMALDYINMLNSIIASPEYDKKYVYFPLHLQPELTTSSLGGVFNDQILAIELIASMIPEDWYIYVKENPKQTEFMRNPEFFERLKLIKKVKVVPRDENSIKLIMNSQFVSTITGTAGWESICRKKPVLVFGKTWYQNFNGVFKFNFEDKNLFEKITSCNIQTENIEKDMEDLLSRMPGCIVDACYTKAVEHYNEEENLNTIKQVLYDYIE